MCLETDQAVGKQLVQQLAVPRQRRQDVRCQKRDMQKEPDRRGDVPPPQFCAKREEVTIVDPNAVAGLQPVLKDVGEVLIDVAVGSTALAIEMAEI